MKFKVGDQVVAFSASNLPVRAYVIARARDKHARELYFLGEANHPDWVAKADLCLA